MYILLSSKCHKKTKSLIEELGEVLPNAMVIDDEEFYNQHKIDRNNFGCFEKTNNAINAPIDSNNAQIPPYIYIHEDIGPQYIVINIGCTQFVYKLISYRSRSDLGIQSKIKSESQLILNNFKSDIGLKVANSFMDLIPLNIDSNQVINFTVKGDFIYFRMYRFVIRVVTGSRSIDMRSNSHEKKIRSPSGAKPILEQIGPQLTLRLWRITEIENDEKKVYDYKKYIKHRNLL